MSAPKRLEPSGDHVGTSRTGPNHRAGAENGDHFGVEVASGSPISGVRYCDRGQG
jgi:hypothetical protein